MTQNAALPWAARYARKQKSVADDVSVSEQKGDVRRAAVGGGNDQTFAHQVGEDGGDLDGGAPLATSRCHQTSGEGEDVGDDGHGKTASAVLVMVSFAEMATNPKTVVVVVESVSVDDAMGMDEDAVAPRRLAAAASHLHPLVSLEKTAHRKDASGSDLPTVE